MIARGLLLTAALLATQAGAGGLDEVAADVDPCMAVEPPTDGSVTDEMLAMWPAIRAMSCPEGVEPRAFFDRATGARLSDAELLRRIFDGSRIEPITPVPLGGAFTFLVVGLLALGVIRSRGA